MARLYCDGSLLLNVRTSHHISVHSLLLLSLSLCFSRIENGQLAVPTLKEFQQHQIIVTTLSTSRTLALMGMPKGHFSHIFIDEAAQVRFLPPLPGFELNIHI